MKKHSSIQNVILQQFTVDDGKKIRLNNGVKFGPVTIAYETYGCLNADKSNAVLIAHALSGDAHAAGFYSDEKKPGWWDAMIGPGKAFDTDRYFVICSNVLGGCKGSTGPSSINSDTGKPYALGFPIISIQDMVYCQKKLVEYLGIDKLLCVCGGSMGGMQVLGWMSLYPEALRAAIPIATAMKHSPQQIAFNEVGRQAIMSDPNWKDGEYYGTDNPLRGLALARMIGHITYMSDESMEKKFGRQKKVAAQKLFKFTPDFEVERYLHYRGDNFVQRFDANSYLYITEAMDDFEICLRDSFKNNDIKTLVIAFKSDWLYPCYQSREIVKECKLAGVEVSYCEVDSKYGHDAFLLETEQETRLVAHFLKKLSS